LAGLNAQREEINELKKSFRIIDSNGDGFLTIDELREGLGQVKCFEL
jgi:Ca2+-binding EF-hand superfamily protein